MADALNSLLDIVANIIVWLGLRIAVKPPDRDHPYGHGNADTLAAVFVAIILFVTGAYIGREAVDTIRHGDFQKPTYLATAAALFTILLKSILYKYTLDVGRKFKSPAVIANARDHISDVVVSVGTLAGILVAQLKYPILDPIAGLWVAVFILKQGVRIIRDNVHTLMSGSPEPHLQLEIQDFIAGLADVVEVNWLKGRMVGQDYYLDVAILVKGSITVREGHEIAHVIRNAVTDKFPEVADILVHVEPDEDLPPSKS